MRGIVTAGLLLVVLFPGCDGSVGPPCKVSGCNGAVLCEKPADLSAAGPWPVGARTVDISGLTTEVWYPAKFGSESGQDPVVYDMRLELPPEERRKIPNEDNPWQTCSCFAGLPLDSRHGPYPVLVFLHGTASFRTQSLSQMTHWASRGFVVLAADYPGLKLADALQLNMNPDLVGDTNKLLDAVRAAAGDLAFLAGHIDSGRMGIVGHSAGAEAIAGFSSTPGIQVVIPEAGEGVQPGSEVRSVLVMGAVDDQVVPYTNQQQGFQDSPKPKRLLGIANAGHLVFTDMCALKNAKGEDVVTIATEHGVTNASLATLMFDGCKPGQIDPAAGWQIVDFATAAVFEETLHCSQTGQQLAGIQERFSLVTDYQEDL